MKGWALVHLRARRLIRFLFAYALGFVDDALGYTDGFVPEVARIGALMDDGVVADGDDRDHQQNAKHGYPPSETILHEERSGDGGVPARRG